MSCYNRILSLTGSALVLAGLALAASGFTQEPQAAPPMGQGLGTAHPHPPPIVRPGVATPGVSRLLTDIKTEAVFPVEGTPDWSVATKDSVWVSSARANHVVQLIPAT